jgi:ferrous iron transport protein A
MNMPQSLEDIAIGQRARVLGFVKRARQAPEERMTAQGENRPSRDDLAYRQRLLSMGLTPGTEFLVTRVAPMGDPVEISLRGFSLSLRRDEAAMLLVEPVDAQS